MFDVRICDINEVEKYVQTWKPQHILSLAEPLKNYGPYHKMILFSDFGSNLPTLDQIKEIAEFGKSVEGRILVHCQKGLSRSPAAALIMLIARGMSPLHAWEEVKHIRPFIMPNEYMLELANDLFDEVDVLELLNL